MMMMFIILVWEKYYDVVFEFLNVIWLFLRNFVKIGKNKRLNEWKFYQVNGINFDQTNVKQIISFDIIFELFCQAFKLEVRDNKAHSQRKTILYPQLHACRTSLEPHSSTTNKDKLLRLPNLYVSVFKCLPSSADLRLTDILVIYLKLQTVLVHTNTFKIKKQVADNFCHENELMKRR
jgi:hypothetical protein